MGTRSSDVGLGLRMQEGKGTHKRVLLCHDGDDGFGFGFGFGFGGGGGSGSGGGSMSMLCNTSNQVACMGDMYDVGAVSGAGSAVSKSLNPFNTDSCFTTFSSSGELTTTSMNVRIPFTPAQWLELERQTMIYKHMIASVPVPPELLVPITKSAPNNVPPSQSNMVRGSLELRLSSSNNNSSNSNSDPEPWRCRRTDGKKWRCSRDVAPDQRYCERHSHKTRPRSRKPVELHTNIIHNNNNSNNNDHNNTHLVNQKTHFVNQINSHLSVYPNVVSANATSYDQPRCLEWFMKGETLPVVASELNQEWQQLKRDSTNTKCNDQVCNFQQQNRQHEHHLNSNLCMNLGGGLQAQRLSDQCSLLLYPNNQTQAQETRHFIDAWSTPERDINIDGISNNCSVSSKEKLPLSSLTLSMPGGSESNEETTNAHMGTFGIMGSDRENVGALRPQWLNPASWMGSPPGGPLAEALCLGIASSAREASNVASPHGYTSSSTTTSSCSKSSCGDGGQAPSSQF